jgi:adenylate cyclase
METAVGEEAAESFVEEEEEQRHLDSFRRETIGVAGAVTLWQAVALELAEVVAELVQAVGSGGEVEACEDGVVDLLGGPAANLCRHARGLRGGE